MKLYGLQKMTLLDFPGRVACTVFLGGCDFRCPFCHNYDLAVGKYPPLMEDEEFLKFLEGRKGLLDGVAFTGGEPLLWRQLPELMEKIRAMGFGIKLDTNGNHPDLLESILDRGLVDYVAMDIKNSKEKYPATCGVDAIDFSLIEKSIELIITKAPDYEFRTTCIAQYHTPRDFHAMGEMVRGAKRYFLQSFTTRDMVPDKNLSAPSVENLHEFAKILENYVLSTGIRGV